MIVVKLSKSFKKNPGPFWRGKRFWFLALILLIFAILSGAAVFASQFGKRMYPEKNFVQVAGDFGQLIISGDRAMEEESAGRDINALLMGVGGEGSFGGITPDTIIILSVRPDGKNQLPKVSLLSIPRDLAASLSGQPVLHKINDAYKLAEFQRPGSGPQAEIASVEEWTGLKIPYYAVIDTNGFTEAVDLVGGVDVTVDRAFYDPYYPDGRGGYLAGVKFEEGQQHLDGARALQYVRSRHGNNGEASDFARSRRQDKVVLALRDKIKALSPISDLSTVSKLLEVLANRLKTNLEPWQIKRVYNLAAEAPAEGVARKFLDPKTGLVCSQISSETGWYLLVSCEGKSKQDVYDWTAKRFEP
ncbi:MAG: LCP family protein [bacterium]|nr:LCP family protein [bacterium]